MNNSGIISQYGFLYQKKVFIFFLLKNISTDKKFCYESKDDIEIAQDERIGYLYDDSNNLVQVKSGIVKEDCFKKIIGNWLLLDQSPNNKFTIFLENNLPFSIDIDNYVDIIIDFIKNGKKKRFSSIARRVYEKYKNEIENDNLSKLKNYIKDILSNINYTICSVKELELWLENIFFENHCQDIKEYDIAKHKRLERFIQNINQQIDKALQNKKPYILFFSELMKILTQTSEEINDHNYTIDIMSFKKNKKDEAKKIVEQRNCREVKQLSLVNSNEEFIINGIIHELLYKDFRDVFIDNNSIEISNLELNAKENFDSVLFDIDESEKTPKTIYSKTTAMTIDSSILPKGSLYSKGCYNYLTGENIDEEKQISWGVDDEVK